MSSDIVIAREYQRGRVVLASPQALKPSILDVTKIAVWGSKAVSCCVVSNNLDATQIGVSRRSVLGTAAGKSAHLVVSETLVAVRNSPLKTFVTYSLTDPTLAKKKKNPADTMREEQIDLLKTAAATDGKPWGVQGSSSQQQQPVAKRTTNPHPSDAVPGALYMDTTISVSPVDSDPEKSFVEIFIEFGAADAYKADELAFFLDKCWGGPLLESLADYALNLSFPVQKGPTDLQFRKLYERHEDTVVRICAKKHIDDELKARAEALLDALYASYRDAVAAQAQTEHMKEELHSALLLLRESNQNVAELQSELHVTSSKLLLLQHAGEQAPQDASDDAADQQQQQQQQAQKQQKSSVSVTPVKYGSSEQQQQQQQNALPPTPRSSVGGVAKGAKNSNAGGSNSAPSSEVPVLRGAVATQNKQQFVLTPEMRSRQVVSAIDEFSVQRHGGGGAMAVYNQLAHPVFGARSSDESLRAKFDALDVERQGYVTVESLAGLLAAIDPADDFDIKQRMDRERQLTPRSGAARSRAQAASAVRQELDNPQRNPRDAVHFRESLEFCQRYCRDKTGKRVAFDEFAVFALKLERAL